MESQKPPKIPTTPSKWHNLPPDILASLAHLLDKHTGISILQLRSICSSWRSSLSPLQPSFLFPFNTPSFTLHQLSLFLLSNPQQTPFFIKPKTRPNPNPAHFTLLDPLSKNPISTSREPRVCDVSLLEYRVTLVCRQYYVDCSAGMFRVKKMVSGSGFFEEGDFVVLGLSFDGGLLVWRFGEMGWREIVAPGRVFDDVISFNGKFYATADGKGRLVVIDSRLKPVVLVPRLVFGDGSFTSLVECDGGLYLVDKQVGYFGDGEYRFCVFKLDDKGRFWDFEHDLNDCVFFLGDEANFALSRKEYSGRVKNVIFFRDSSLGGDGVTRVFDLKTGTCCRVDYNEEYSSLYWPPWCRFGEG